MAKQNNDAVTEINNAMIFISCNLKMAWYLIMEIKRIIFMVQALQ